MTRRSRYKRRNDEQGIAGGIVLLAILAYGWFHQATWVERGAAVVFFGTVLIMLAMLYHKITSYRLTRRRLMDLSGSEFEQRIALLIKEMGWTNVKQRGGSGDGGIDITAQRDGQTWAVQCKRYAKPVAPGAVRDLIGAAALVNADKALLVTTSRFTDQGKQHAKGRVMLWDGETTAKYIDQIEKRKQTPQARSNARLQHAVVYGMLVAINGIMLVWLTLPSL